jgi:glycosyltransferase involved in cell wall biosynthesis
MNNPTFSIITVCLNSAAHIEKAIQSVLSQAFDSYEYIVVDGESNDGTLEIIDKYRTSIQKVVSEKDDGIYAAMNKGIDLSSGDILYFLNSDDSLFDDQVLADLAKEFKYNPTTELIYGFVERENVPAHLVQFQTKHIIRNRYDLLKAGICHQALFIKRSLINRVGYFDSKYAVYADYDWLVSAFTSKVNFKNIDRTIARYNYKGFSYTMGRQARGEVTSIIRHRFGFHIFLYYCFRYVFLRELRRVLSRNQTCQRNCC